MKMCEPEEAMAMQVSDNEMRAHTPNMEAQPHYLKDHRRESPRWRLRGHSHLDEGTGLTRYREKRKAPPERSGLE